MPVSNYEQIVRFSAVCAVTIPAWLKNLFDGTAKNPDLRRVVASVVAAEQIRTLQTYGLNEFHVSTLNRSDLTCAIAHILGVRPTQANASHNVTAPLETTEIPDERETPANFDTPEWTQEGTPPFMLRPLFG